MAIELWTSGELYEVLEDQRRDPIPSFWLDSFFSTPFYSGDREIKFAELPAADRKLAPFVLPTEQGKPIMNYKGETVTAFMPGYVKVKDPVRAVDARTIKPSEILRNGGTPPSIEQRFDARVAEVTAYHRRAIQMRNAYMAAQAAIDAKVTVKYDRDQGSQYPEVTIDYGRDANLNVMLSTTFWDDAAYDIIGDLNDWSNLMYTTKFGGRPNRMIIGADVVPCIQKNNGIRALLSTQIRGGEGTQMKLGLLNVDTPYSYVATIGGVGQSIEIWTYRDQVEDRDGTLVELLDPKDVLLLAPGYRGVQAYGAIYNAKAMQGGQAVSTDVFPSMWLENDPADYVLMHESAPLPVNLTPNKALKATVLDG
ncbi:major capsid protein [Mesorhizobium sp. B2-8-9]|uniref:major capsid protein n=1 Tax=Mesorhizobium sp. B2-8-9 TaxID=2589899 RepID=UPI001127E0C8|nr:major capsid protein [Mesorhizobium sp. B2-8-9]TPI86356.1 hypothetical protein FJ423_00600 [Mesorhizobium sp. B2-8-9]